MSEERYPVACLVANIIKEEADRQIYGGEITFPEPMEIRKVLRNNKWHKPYKYSRLWCHDTFPERSFDLKHAYNLHLNPDRINKINPNWPYPREVNFSYWEKNFYKPDQVINIGLDYRNS